jgi:hypothetical protein
MLGYKLPNNNLHIYLEDQEIIDLKNNSISGIFHNNSTAPLGALEVAFNKECNELVKTTFKLRDDRSVSYLQAELHPNFYHRLTYQDRHGIHEGWRHVRVFKASKLKGLDKAQYTLLCDDITGRKP